MPPRVRRLRKPGLYAAGFAAVRAEVRREYQRCRKGTSSTMTVMATTAPEIGRVKKTVQSFEKLIMEFMKFSSAIGPRMTPSTSGATGNLSR